MTPGRIVIAIDGPAAAGKGTLARSLAARFELPHLDTGLLYRATAARAAEGAVSPAAAARALSEADLARPDLRGAAAAQAASAVAADPEVRAALLGYQRAFAARPGGAVLDGRDICTVIAPDADVKLFVTASPEVRARRRHAELTERGDAPPYDEVLADVRARDARDAARADAPLRRAEGAALIDTSELTAAEALEAAAAIVARAMEARDA